MACVYTLTLSPSLDSATVTSQIYSESKLRCSSPIFEPGGGGINVARAIAYLGGKATAIFPVGGATGEHLVTLLENELITIETVETKNWTRQNLHVYIESSGEQYRFVMPGASLSDNEFHQLKEKTLSIDSNALLVISGSLPSNFRVNEFTGLLKAAQKRGIRCIIDSSGDALTSVLELDNIELIKPNKRELGWLVGHELVQQDDIYIAALELIQQGKVKRIVVSLGSQGALAVDKNNCVCIMPPQINSQSTVGAGDSMVGAMTLKLAEGASLEEITRYGVAAGSAATINKGTHLCSLEDTQKIYALLNTY